MKLTKYPQSCFLIEEGDGRILIDPGRFVFEQLDVKPADFTGIDAIFITHEHPDHAEPSAIAKLQAANGCPVYCPRSFVTHLELSNVKPTAFIPDAVISIGSLKVRPVALTHGDPGSGFPVPEMFGLVINDLVYHSADAVTEQEHPQAPIILAAIAGPGLSPEEAVKLARRVGARTIVPTHYSNPKHGVSPDQLKGLEPLDNLVVKVLAEQETLDLDEWQWK